MQVREENARSPQPPDLQENKTGRLASGRKTLPFSPENRITPCNRKLRLFSGAP